MAEIRIRLIGNVAFENDMKLSEGFRYDIPVDRIGIPRIPIARLLPASVIGGRHVGFALPEGYLGLAAQAEKLARLRSDIVPLITACFTDKKRLHYRLSPGKDPSRVEQDVGVGDAYARSFENRLTIYTKPETERIASRGGKMVDALSCGQMFRGVIYGSDSDLKALLMFLKAHKHMTMGSLTREGFGDVRVGAERLAAAEIRAERLARRFDVSCLSHALILNSRGMQDTSAEGFLEEVERVLNAPGRLRIVGKYMSVYMDYSWNPRWQQDGMVSRCLAKGSVMRLETVDGQPIDIAPLLHAFIGERTRDGYGEIMAYPALDGYYRAAEQRAPEKYGLKYPMTFRSASISTNLIRRVLEMILQRRVKSLAVIDQRDARSDGKSENAPPLELLRDIRDRFDPFISDDKLIRWYLDGLEVESDGFLS